MDSPVKIYFTALVKAIGLVVLFTIGGLGFTALGMTPEERAESGVPAVDPLIVALLITTIGYGPFALTILERKKQKEHHSSVGFELELGRHKGEREAFVKTFSGNSVESVLEGLREKRLEEIIALEVISADRPKKLDLDDVNQYLVRVEKGLSAVLKTTIEIEQARDLAHETYGIQAYPTEYYLGPKPEPVPMKPDTSLDETEEVKGQVRA